LALFGHLALYFERARRQVGVPRRKQESIEAAAMINGFQRICRNPQSNRTAECIGDQRDIEEIGQKTPLGFAVGVADPVADLPRFSGQLASPCHGRESLRIKAHRSRAPRAAFSAGLGMARTYSGRVSGGQARPVADQTQALADAWRGAET